MMMMMIIIIITTTTTTTTTIFKSGQKGPAVSQSKVRENMFSGPKTTWGSCLEGTSELWSLAFGKGRICWQRRAESPADL